MATLAFDMLRLLKFLEHRVQCTIELARPPTEGLEEPLDDDEIEYVFVSKTPFTEPVWGKVVNKN